MARKNSMDVIQVRYGVDLSTLPRFCRSSVERQIVENKKKEAKTCSLRAFIYPEQYPDEAPKSLTESERNIQSALRFLYEQNGKDALYGKFPNWRQALVIDCTTTTSKFACGKFNADINTISFKKALNPAVMVGALAHELKHAECCTRQIYKITEKKVGTDNLGIQQTLFLDEGIAYPFGNYVRMLYHLRNGNLSKQELVDKMYETEDAATDVLLEPLLNWMAMEPKPTFWDRLFKREPKKNYKDLEQKLIPLALDSVYGTPYTTAYAGLYPIRETDKGLRKIPKAFKLESKYAKSLLLGKLQEIPRGTFSEISQYVSKQIDKSDAKRALRNAKKQGISDSSVAFSQKIVECAKSGTDTPRYSIKSAHPSFGQQVAFKIKQSQH